MFSFNELLKSFFETNLVRLTIGSSKRSYFHLRSVNFRINLRVGFCLFGHIDININPTFPWGILNSRRTLKHMPGFP